MASERAPPGNWPVRCRQDLAHEDRHLALPRVVVLMSTPGGRATSASFVRWHHDGLSQALPPYPRCSTLCEEVLDDRRKLVINLGMQPVSNLNQRGCAGVEALESVQVGVLTVWGHPSKHDSHR